jgi:hypothetical protein
MDYIGVLTFDAQGPPEWRAAFHRAVHLQRLFNRRPWDIPLVRERHEYVMAKSGLAVRSHSGKALRHILESLPRDELFQSGEEELFRTAMGILGLQERIRQQAVPAPRPLRPLLLGPGLHSARPLHQRDPAPDRSDADGGAERPAHRHHDPGGRVAAGAVAPDRASEGRRAGPRWTAPSWKRGWHRSCATGTTSCAMPWSHGMARTRA